MDNQKVEIYKIDETLAKTIVNRNFYYSAHNKDSEFAQLPRHYQRAIEREAAFQVKTLAQTEGFADILNKDNMAEAQNLHNAICEYYAHRGNLEEKKHPNHPSNFFTGLLHLDTDATIQNSLMAFQKSKDPNIDYIESLDKEPMYDKTTRRAKHFNARIAERKAKGIEHDAAATIQNIYAHIKGYGRG